MVPLQIERPQDTPSTYLRGKLERQLWSIADTSNNRTMSNRSFVFMPSSVWGVSECLRTTLHLHLPTFRHLTWAEKTLNRYYLSNCEMFDNKTNILCPQMTKHQEM